MIVVTSVRPLLIGLALLAGLQSAKAESIDITTLYSTPISLVNGTHPLWTPVQHYRGKTFYVVPDAVDLRPKVTQIDDVTGVTTTVYLDPGADYKAMTDGHNRFTLGIDPDGYLHVMGDMHGYSEWADNYVERYQYQNIMYWKSNRPLDVTAGFTYAGAANSKSHLPGVEWGGDSRMFNDKNGVLYFSARVRAFTDSKTLSGSEPFIAYGVYRYDHNTGMWTALGGTAEYAVPEAKNFNTVLYWEYTTSFEAFQSNPRFDSKNRLHFSISGGESTTKGSSLIYAVSDDFGATWKKANGELIATHGRPLRAKDGEPNQGDLVERPHGSQGSAVFIDKDGKIALNGKTWNGTAWIPYKGGVGLLGPDGMLTNVDSLQRTAGLGQPVANYESGFGQIMCVSELGLQNTGAIYGVGLPKRTNFTNAQQAWVYKAIFGPQENIARGGKASSSAGSTEPNQAFDGQEETQWSTTAAVPGWLAYALGKGARKAVVRYDLTCTASGSPDADPKSWTLEGSQDGEKWIPLDSRKDQFFVTRNQTKSYTVATCPECVAYRLNIVETHGANGGIQLAELKLFAVDASVKPAAPRLFFAQGDNGKVWLSWTQPDHAASYTIKRAPEANGPFAVLAKGVINPGDFPDTTAVNGTTYYYAVSAVNAAGESPDSTPVKVTPKPTAPRPPLIQMAVGRNCRIVLHWLPLWPEAASYTVKRSETSGGPYAVIVKGVPGLTFTDIGLLNDKIYFYVVSASDKNGLESVNSQEISGAAFRWLNPLHYQSARNDDKGTASASAENGAENAHAAFNGRRGGKWLAPTNNKPVWLQYKFVPEEACAVTRYQIMVCKDGADDRDPKDWEFLGSKDGTEWVVLDVQKNQKFKDLINTYVFENPTKYQYYRLNVTKTNGSGLCALRELIFWVDDAILKEPPALTPFPTSAPFIKSPDRPIWTKFNAYIPD